MENITKKLSKNIHTMQGMVCACRSSNLAASRELDCFYVYSAWDLTLWSLELVVHLYYKPTSTKHQHIYIYIVLIYTVTATYSLIPSKGGRYRQVVLQG